MKPIIYGPAEMKARLAYKPSGDSVILSPSDDRTVKTADLPKELKVKEALTLDQIDARQVKIGIKVKASYRQLRVRITDKEIRLMMHPSVPVVGARQILELAIEARRRLRHPNSESFTTPFGKIAWGSFEPKESILTITIDGKEVDHVEKEDIQRPPAGEYGADQSRLIVG